MTYSVSVTIHIPKKARSMPTWALWSWNHVSTSHPHRKQKSKYNPKLKRGAWWMGGARALPQQIKSQSWVNWWAQICLQTLETIKCHITAKREPGAKREQRRESSFWNTFGAINDYMNVLNPCWRWLVVLNLALNWKGCKKKKKNCFRCKD